MSFMHKNEIPFDQRICFKRGMLSKELHRGPCVFAHGV